MIYPEMTAISAWLSFTRAKSKVWRSAYRELREHGISGTQYDILYVLHQSGEEGVKLNELSQRLWVTSGNVTGLVDRLEEAGYIERKPHPDDRRITLAVLTEQGRELFAHICPQHVARVQRLMSALTTSEQIVLRDLLNRLADKADELDT